LRSGSVWSAQTRGRRSLERAARPTGARQTGPAPNRVRSTGRLRTVPAGKSDDVDGETNLGGVRTANDYETNRVNTSYRLNVRALF
jgi:hypothetical protein